MSPDAAEMTREELESEVARLRSEASRWYLSDGTYSVLSPDQVTERRKRAAREMNELRNLPHVTGQLRDQLDNSVANMDRILRRVGTLMGVREEEEDMLMRADEIDRRLRELEEWRREIDEGIDLIASIGKTVDTPMPIKSKIQTHYPGDGSKPPASTSTPVASLNDIPQPKWGAGTEVVIHVEEAIKRLGVLLECCPDGGNCKRWVAERINELGRVHEILMEEDPLA